MLLGFTVLTVAMTWPVAALFGRGINAFGDVVLQMTALTWDAHALTTNPLRVFDAPFFYPYAHSNAFSESLIGEALVALPLFWLTGGDPGPAHNFNFLLSFVLTGYGTYLLTRDLTGHRPAAWAAGMAYAFTGYRFVQSGHLNVLATEWLPLTLWALRRGLRGNHGGYLALAAFFVVCMGLFSVYLFYFLALLVVLYLVWWAVWGRRANAECGVRSADYDGAPVESEPHAASEPSSTQQAARRCSALRNPQSAFCRSLPVKLIVAGLGAGLVLLPFYLPYLAVNRELGLARSVYEVQGWAAKPGFFLNVLPTNWLWATLLPDLMVSSRGERQLFPGAIITALAVVGLVAGRRSSVVGRQSDGERGRLAQSITYYVLRIRSAFARPTAHGPRPTAHSPRPTAHGARPTAHDARPADERGFYLLLAGAAVVLTFGVRVRVPGQSWDLPLPYALLYDWVPGFTALRVPVRFVVLLDLALAVLGGYGLAWLVPWLTARRRVLRLLVGPLLALLLLEYVQVRDLRNNRAMRPPDPQPYTWLASHPGPTVELPMGEGLFSDVWYTYWATYDWQPLVSGAGSFMPPGTVAVARALATFPDAASVALLQGLAIRHVVIHQSQYPAATRQALTASLARTSALHKVFTAGADEVYEVSADPWLGRIAAGLPAGGQVWLGRGAENRAPALETLAYGLQYGRLPSAALPPGAGVAGDLTVGSRPLPPLPFGRPADLTLLPTGDPAGADAATVGTAVYSNALATLYRRDPDLRLRYDLTAPNAPTAPHGLAVPAQGTRFAPGGPVDTPYRSDLLFAAFAPTEVQVGAARITLAPGLSRYRTPVAAAGSAPAWNLRASGAGGPPLLLRADVRTVAAGLSAQQAALLQPLTHTLVLDLAASSADSKMGLITTAWRVVPQYPGKEPLTLSLDIYQKPFGTHPDGHLGTWSLPLPADAAGRSYTLTLNPVAKTATALINGGGTQVFAWTGPPHWGDFTATLNLYAGDRLLAQLPAYDFTLDDGTGGLLDFQPAPGTVLVLPFGE